jgi:hypothetical protein
MADKFDKEDEYDKAEEEVIIQPIVPIVETQQTE